jgi:uncharacterized membrane protein
MTVLLVLFTSLLIFRGLGALGIGPWTTWHDASLYALALMFLFTSSAHFTSMKHDLVKMVPRVLPQPLLLVYCTGLFEVLAAIGILLPHFRSVAGSCLIVLLIALFPANVKAARQSIPLRGKPPTPLWLRAPMQVLFIALTWWSTEPLRLWGQILSR